MSNETRKALEEAKLEALTNPDARLTAEERFINSAEVFVIKRQTNWKEVNQFFAQPI